MRKVQQLYLSLAMIAFVSCGNYEELKSEPTTPFGNVANVSGLTFAQVQEQVLGPKCLRCHGGYADYTTVRDDLPAILAEVLAERMPEPPNAPLSDEEKNILVSWSNAGAPLGEVVAVVPEPSPTPEPEPSPAPQGFTFADIQEQIMAPKCVSCHGGYADYNTVKNDLPAILEEVLNDRMPLGSSPLTDEEKNMLVTWSDQGAPLGNVVTQPEPEEGLQPTWESISRNILQKKCTSCHNSQGMAAFVPLTTRFEVFQQRDVLLNFDQPQQSYLLEVITDPDEPMPPLWSSFEPVTDEEIAVLTEWIRLGLP